MIRFNPLNTIGLFVAAFVYGIISAALGFETVVSMIVGIVLGAIYALSFPILDVDGS